MKLPVLARLVFGTVLAALALGWTVSADQSTPADSITRLKAGNAAFVAQPEGPLNPFATVLSCADSRVPPEVVFHTGLGDLFVVRAAGEVLDRSVVASIEYGSEHLHIPLIVVMGHEFCGAVKAAVETPAGTSLGPNLDFMLQAIKPAVKSTADVKEADRLKAAILANVQESMVHLVDDSKILRHLYDEKKVTIVGAYYELATGKVMFSSPLALPATTHR
jgi:carbonic anhydrase